jgi:MipA family protein
MPGRSVAVVTLLCACGALAEEAPRTTEALAPPRAPDWMVIVGAGALTVPSYPGASTFSVMPVPFLDVRYRNVFFLSPLSGLGVNAIATDRVQAGISVMPEFGRSESSGDRLRAWGDLGMGASVKVFGGYDVGPFSLVADVRRQLGAGNGTLVGAGVARSFFFGRRLILFTRATLTWADARYFRSYFGVSDAQSAAALSQEQVVPTYAAHAGLRDANLAAFAVIPIDMRWSVQTFLRAEYLLGDAAASPLTERRFQPAFGGVLGYRL